MRSRRAVGTAAAALLGVLVAAPAIAGAGQGSDPGGQPPPGSRVEKTSDFRLGSQPPAGAQVVKETDFRLGKQPVNRNPQRPTKLAKVRDTDRGVKNLPVKKDRGKQNLPVQRDLGDR